MRLHNATLITPWAIHLENDTKIRHRDIWLAPMRGHDATGLAIVEIITEDDKSYWVLLKPWQLRLFHRFVDSVLEVR